MFGMQSLQGRLTRGSSGWGYQILRDDLVRLEERAELRSAMDHHMQGQTHLEDAALHSWLVEGDYTEHALAETVRGLDERQDSDRVAVLGDIIGCLGRMPAEHFDGFSASAFSVLLHQLIITLDEAALTEPSPPYRAGNTQRTAVGRWLRQGHDRRRWGQDPAPRIHSAGR